MRCMNMKKMILNKMKVSKIIIFVLTVCMSIGFTIIVNCDAWTLKKELNNMLKPEYNYDLSKVIKINYKKEKQIKEIEVDLFIGERYKFLFNAKALTKDIKVEIYNKSLDKQKRELLFSNEEYLKKGEKIYYWLSDKSRRKVYIDYEIPPIDSTMAAVNNQECLVFMLGYKIK